jgi:hypothetical protein
VYFAFTIHWVFFDNCVGITIKPFTIKRLLYARATEVTSSMFVLKNLSLPTKVFLICSVFYYYYFDKSVYYFHMFTGMLVDLEVHHGGMVRHEPFSYVDGDVHDVPGYDVQFFTM